MPLPTPSHMNGMPFQYDLETPQSLVHAPNLTDASVRGLYAASTRVPAVAKQAVNRVSAIIGAPGLNGQPATAIIAPTGGGAAPRPNTTIPFVVHKLIARGTTLLSGMRAKLLGPPTRIG